MSASDRALGSARGELDLSKPISVAYQLKLSHTSVLDSTFIDAKSRRAIYMTVTHDGATSLIRLSEHGEETVVGEVWWQGGRGNHDRPGHALVVVHEQTMRFEDFLKRSNGFLKNKCKVFQADGMHCRWRRGANSSLVYPAMHTFFCQLTSYIRPPTSSTSRNASSTSVTISPERMVALFTSPDPGSVSPEILVYDVGAHIMDEVILTCIMVCAGKLEWREIDTAGRLSREGYPGLSGRYSASHPQLGLGRSISITSSAFSRMYATTAVTESEEEDERLPPSYLRSVPAGEQTVHIIHGETDNTDIEDDVVALDSLDNSREAAPSYDT